MLEITSTLLIWFLLFLIYSAIGYITETIYHSIDERKFRNRGFLVGPYIPVWGIGAVLIATLLAYHTDDLITIFFLGMILCGILEYTTSWLLEKIFHNKWWDYSHARDNINGRVRVSFLALFGLGGVIVVAFLNPFLYSLLSSLSIPALFITSFTLLAIFLVDVTYSTIVAYDLRNIIIIAEDLKNQKIAMVETKIKAHIAHRLTSIRNHSDRILHEFPRLKNRAEINLVQRLKREIRAELESRKVRKRKPKSSKNNRKSN